MTVYTFKHMSQLSGLQVTKKGVSKRMWKKINGYTSIQNRISLEKNRIILSNLVLLALLLECFLSIMATSSLPGIYIFCTLNYTALS